MNINLKECLSFATIAGSRAYGINTETSDTDVTGFLIPPKEIVLGFSFKVEQKTNDDYIKTLIPESKLNTKKEVESQIYEIKKFFHLTSQCNPNIIEIIWSPEENHLYRDKFAEKILAHKNDFLSKKARWTFHGYAHAQLQRIQTHRRWLLNPVLIRPIRSNYGLGEVESPKIKEAQSSIRKTIDRWDFNDLEIERHELIRIKEKITDLLSYCFESLGINIRKDEIYDEDVLYLAAIKKIGFDDNLMELLVKERKFQKDLQDYKNYENWKTNRNPDRAILEAKYGYDCKFAVHLVRLIRMSIEILKGEGVIVKRPDADELKAIRNGSWTFDQLMEYVEKTNSNIDQLYSESKIPNKINLEKLNNLCLEILEERYNL